MKVKITYDRNYYAKVQVQTSEEFHWQTIWKNDANDLGFFTDGLAKGFELAGIEADWEYIHYEEPTEETE